MKKLSIAIPTLNRSEYLKFTLDHFIPQIIPVENEVELIIVNNNSDDDTSDVVSKIAESYNFIKFYDCKDRFPLGEQFKRTVNYSTGEYIILWGDDDIPAPFLIKYILNNLINNTCKLYYFNRLSGYENGCGISSLNVDQNCYNERRTIYTDSSSFIKDNFLNATFITSILFHRDVWNCGLSFDTSSHYGYEFMGILYYGNKDGIIIRDNYPLCIQRKVAFRAWGPYWAKYKLLGIPNMVKDLQDEGLFKNGLKIWESQYNGFLLFLYTLLSAATNKKLYKPYCSKFAKYQRSYLRKSLIYAIIYLCPGFIYNLSRKILFKKK